MAKDLADLVVSLELQSAKYMQGMDQATARLNKFHKDTQDSLSGIADLFAGFLSADAILEFAKKTLDASAELSNLSKSAGIAVEQLSALQFAAQAGGVGTDGLNNSLKKLNVSISDAAGSPTSKAAVAFQLMGINIRDANGHIKDAGTVFKEMADVFQRSADGPNKVALAVATLGKEGQALIPTLDKGSAGLKELADQAAAAGAIIDGPTAEAANAFNDKLNLLKATLVDGLGAQVEKALLPVLNSLADDFLGTSTKADNMRIIVDEVVTGFKLLITAGLTVREIFGQIGDAIGGAIAAAEAAGGPLGRINDAFKVGGVGAAAAAAGLEVYKGSFKDAVAILDDQSNHAQKSAEDTANAILNVWNTVSAGVGKAVGDTTKKTKDALGSLSGAIAAQAAMKELQAFVDGLQGEVLKLDQGKVAATSYALAHGKLADALKLTGAAGQKLAADAVAAATKIETTEINKQLEGLQSQLKALSGDTAGAALDSFSKSVEQLERQLKDVGGDVQASGQIIIDNLKQATVYQNTFNVLQTNAARINQNAAAAQQAVADAQANGSITSIQAEQQLQAIRADTIAQLQGIANGEDAIAAAANNPTLTQGAKAFGASLEHLKAQTDQLTTQIRNDLETAFANDFTDLETGAASFGQTFHKLAQDIQKDLLQIANKNLAESIFGAGGSGSSVPGFLASLFGGAGGGGGSSIASTGAAAAGTDTGALASEIPVFADGGILPQGKLGLVGDAGPELVVGAAGGSKVIPNGELGGSNTHITNNFTIQAAGGTIDRASQMQTAAAVARTVAQANRRNN